MQVLFSSRQTNLFEQFANPHFKISEDYQIIDQVLNNEKIIMRLAKDFPDTVIGRKRTAIEQTLRFLVLKHQKGLDYRSLARTLQVNLEDRWFCKIGSGDNPCFKTIQNQLSCITEETAKAINDQIMQEARKRKLTKGKRMRVDSTVTESNIHYPTDASLISDCVKIITKTLTKFKIVPKGYRNFKRKIKKQIFKIRNIGRKNKVARDKAIGEMVKMGKTVINKTKKIKKKIIKKQRQLLEKIVEQTEKVLAGEKIKDRIVSIFEPEARPIVKGKAGKICEFGHLVQVQEDEKFITDWNVNNESDAKFFPKAIDKHKQLYGKPPKEVATDRGYYSQENVEYAKLAGVKHISLPKKGKLKPEEKEFQSTRKFKQLQRWRAGGEAKISWLKRTYKLDRCLYKGETGMSRWVGAGIIACNLATIAKATAG